LDATALPDPYCQFALDGVRRGATSTVMQTLTPVWNESITTSSSGQNITYAILTSPLDRWAVAVRDEDGNSITLDDAVCSATPRLTAADFLAGTVELPATGSCTGLTWSNDGAARVMSRPSEGIGLRTGYCYRWRLILEDGAGNLTTDISGVVKRRP